MISVGIPNIANREMYFKFLDDAFDRKSLSNRGKYLQKLEQEIADWLNLKEVVAFTSATAALYSVFSILKSEQLVTQAFTYPATALAAINANKNLYVHDIDEDLLLSKSKIPPKSIICPVSSYGLTNYSKYDLVSSKSLVFDSCHAIGVKRKNELIAGNHGLCEVFSLHATKAIQSGEGGFVATNDVTLARELRTFLDFGKNDNKFHGNGLNFKMSEINAALGYSNILHRQDIFQALKNNYELYKARLRGLTKIKLIDFSEYEEHNYQYITLFASEKSLKKLIMNRLRENGINTREYFKPTLSNIDIIRSTAQFIDDCDVSRRVSDEALILPNYISLDSDNIEKICRIITECID